jgi:DNA-binding NarL/FixJ family response regulator
MEVVEVHPVAAKRPTLTEVHKVVDSKNPRRRKYTAPIEKRLSAATKKKILEMYTAGVRTKEIARRIGCNIRTVRAQIQRARQLSRDSEPDLARQSSLTSG